MTASATPRAISTETETERQHWRVNLPIRLEWGGRTYQVPNWSVAGFGVEGVDLDIGAGSVHEGRLLFTFDTFSFHCDLKFELRWIDRDAKRIGCRVVHSSERAIGMIRHLMHAYLSGELVSVSDVLDVVSRHKDGSPARKAKGASNGAPKRSLGQRLRTAAMTGTVAATSVALVYMLGSSAYRTLYVFEALNARVMAPSNQVASPAEGSVKVLFDADGAAVEAGEPVFSVTKPGGEVVFADSMCDCFAMAIDQASGWVTTGKPVVNLFDRTTPDLYVEATVTARDALRLTRGGAAKVHLPGRAAEDARIDRITVNGDTPSGFALIRLSGMSSLSFADFGNPIGVEFDTLAMAKAPAVPSETAAAGFTGIATASAPTGESAPR